MRFTEGSYGVTVGSKLTLLFKRFVYDADKSMNQKGVVEECSAPVRQNRYVEDGNKSVADTGAGCKDGDEDSGLTTSAGEVGAVIRTRKGPAVSAAGPASAPQLSAREMRADSASHHSPMSGSVSGSGPKSIGE